MTAPTNDTVGGGRLARLAPAVGLVPFLVYLGIFLVVPTVAVVVGALQEDGRFSLANLSALGRDSAVSALWKSVLVFGFRQCSEWPLIV